MRVPRIFRISLAALTVFVATPELATGSEFPEATSEWEAIWTSTDSFVMDECYLEGIAVLGAAVTLAGMTTLYTYSWLATLTMTNPVATSTLGWQTAAELAAINALYMAGVNYHRCRERELA